MSRTIQDLLRDLRETVSEVLPQDLANELKTQAPILIDVREAEECQTGRLPKALHVPRGLLELRIEAEVPNRTAPIVIYCASGTRSLLAAHSLATLGYKNVRSLAGGFTGWSRLGFATETASRLDAEDRARYSRHLLIPEIGERGQEKLLASRVAIVGAGGLGSPAAYYLAAAGVGTLGLIDHDRVDASNLQRQILHTPDRIGVPKTESARRTLSAFNPRLNLATFDERLSADNAMRLLTGWDVIIDGSDNFATRYLLNAICLDLGIPYIHGSVYRFEGTVSVFAPALGGPCYRCLYPEAPPPGQAPSCAEAGVLGVLPGVVGLLQAVEALKLLLGIGSPLVGRLLSYDALEARFREFKIAREPACPGCGSERRPYCPPSETCQTR